MSEGWVCPKCKAGVAPTVNVCPCTSPAAVPFYTHPPYPHPFPSSPGYLPPPPWTVTCCGIGTGEIGRNSPQ